VSVKTIVRSVLLALLLVVPARAEDFTFVHVSDIHVGAGNNVKLDGDMLREIAALQPKPAFVAGTGDLCEVGTETEYADYRKLADAFPLPAYQAPGNHDVRWNPLGKEGFVKGARQPMYQSWSHGGVHFVLLDSTTLLQHWGHFDADMLAWLKKDLAAWGTTKPVVIGFHHPIAREGSQIDNEQELLDLVEPYNVRLWLQGHGHANVQWNVNGAPAVMVQGLYQQAYNVVEIKGDTLRVVRRFVPQPKKNNGELLGDDAKPEVRRREILTAPLARPVAPKWEAKLVDCTRVVVSRGALPADTKLAVCVDGGKYAALDATPTGWAGSFELPIAGKHAVTVQATLPDGRVYQRPLRVATSQPGAPECEFEQQVGGAVMSRLVVADDGQTLLVPSMGGDLVALDPTTTARREKWRVPTKGGVFSTPQVADGVVYFGSADHHVYAADLRSGQVKWKRETGGAVFGGAAVAKGIVCIASCDRTIYGLDAATGDVKWTVKTGGMTQSKVATDGQLFFVGTWDNQFRAIDAATGDVRWSHKFGKSRTGAYSFYFAPAIGAPTVGDGKVFVSSNDGHLHTVDIGSGKLAWETKQSRQLGYSGPLYRDGRVYTASLSGRVYCFDANSDTVIWERDTGGAIYDSSCAYADGKVYIGCVNGTFNAIDATTGQLAWQYHLGPGHVLASPATDARRVYIGSMSGVVSALSLK
jgi:outer membrane protein assembly factor BamB